MDSIDIGKALQMESICLKNKKAPKLRSMDSIDIGQTLQMESICLEKQKAPSTFVEGADHNPG
ncbi:MAG: hypothetical protein AABZ41_06580, partial [Bacteroidota bacterium]